MSDIVKWLNALVIMDEVGSNNQLGKEAAAYIERLEAEFGFLLDRLGDFETQIESDADALEFDAHVRPAIARARAALQTEEGK